MPIKLGVSVISNPDPIPFDDIKDALGDMAEPTKEALAHLKKIVSKYPPKPAGSTYKRTGNLGASWKSQVVGNGNVLGQVISVSSKAPYNVYVQDEQQQAPVHQGRWQTAQQVAKDEQAEVLKIFEAWGKDTVESL